MRHTNRLRRRVRRDWQLYLLLSITLAYFVVFYYWPMAGLQIAFRNYSFRDGIWGSAWVGLTHFRRLFYPISLSESW